MSEKNVPNVRFKGFSESWEQRKLQDVTDYADYRGKSPRKVAKGIQLITASNIRKGYIDYNADKQFVAATDYTEVMHRGLPKIGDVLFTTEAPLGNVAQIDSENIALAQRVIKFRGNDNILINDFLFELFLSPTFQTAINRKSSGGTVKGIKGKTLHQISISFPKIIKEQIMVGKILKNLDQLIASNQRNLDQLKEVKKLLMQKIFDQEWRFEGFTDPWEQRQLGDVINELDRKELASSGLSLVTSSRKGLFKQSDYFNGKKAGIDDDTVFHKLPTGYITYRHMSDDSTFHFNENNFDEDVLVSKEYPVFKVKKDNNQRLIINVLNNSSEFHKFAVLQKKGGTRTRLYFNVLKQFKILLPSTKEQCEIGQYLLHIDQLIASNQQKFDQLKEMKKWFMQNMFV